MSLISTSNQQMSVTLHELLDNIHILNGSTRSTAEVAREMDVHDGAIINTILCNVADQQAMVLMAGDKACDAGQVARVLNLTGAVSMMSEEDVKILTGSGVDALFPLELAETVPTILDASLKRFDLVYSRAGNEKCLIATTFSELKTLTRGVVSYALASPAWHPGMPSD